MSTPAGLKRLGTGEVNGKLESWRRPKQNQSETRSWAFTGQPPPGVNVWVVFCLTRPTSSSVSRLARGQSAADQGSPGLLSFTHHIAQAHSRCWAHSRCSTHACFWEMWVKAGSASRLPVRSLLYDWESQDTTSSPGPLLQPCKQPLPLLALWRTHRGSAPRNHASWS